MVEIKPFKCLKYNKEKIQDLSEVLAPPYDIISEIEKVKLKKNQYNLVNLTLPDETTLRNKYKNAQHFLDEWIEKNILIFDKEDCFYLLEEIFEENKTIKSFFGIIGLLKVEDYGKGKVLRHEKTLPKPKEDRLSLLKSCRANFEFIYTLYNDDDNGMNYLLKEIVKTKPYISTKVDYDLKLKFNLWRINNKSDLDTISKLMKSKTLLIADGHHRYETSRMFKEMGHLAKKSNVSLDKEQSSPQNYILSLFVAGNQKDIMIHSTHRLVKFNKTLLFEDFKSSVEKYFEIEELVCSSYIEIEEKVKNLDKNYSNQLAVYFKDSKCMLLKLKKDILQIYKDLNIDTENFDEDFEYLDVNILHKVIFENILSEFFIEEIKYVHTLKEAIEIINCKSNDLADEPSFDACFILNAPSIETVEKLSVKGSIMPQKSTYFYPKPCSGLVMYKM